MQTTPVRKRKLPAYFGAIQVFACAFAFAGLYILSGRTPPPFSDRFPFLSTPLAAWIFLAIAFVFLSINAVRILGQASEKNRISETDDR
jgi:hypothetical protein